MIKNPLLEKIKAKKTALGVRVHGTDIVDLCAHMGFDFFQIDQMFSSTDWDNTKNLLTMGEAKGITPVVRVQSNPWLGYDHRIAVDVTRAHGIGTQFIKISYSCKKEIEESLLAVGDWHSNILIVHPFKNEEEWDTKINEMADESFIIPAAESKGALEDMEDVIAMPGIKVFMISMTDASRVITGENKPNFYHPKMWEFIDKAVKLGEKHGVVIGTNPSYAYTLKEMRERVKRIHEAGVKIIMIQGFPFLAQVAISDFLGGVREDLKLS